MISGMYLGEIVRLVCMDLVERNILLKGTLSENLKTKGSFETMFVSEIER